MNGSRSRDRRDGETNGRRSSQYSRPSHMLNRHQSDNASMASFVSEVEMAHDEIFSGPISESIPTHTTGFFHGRDRSDSIASFAFYDQDEEQTPDSSQWPEDEVILEEDEEAPEDGIVIDEVEPDGSEHRPSHGRRKSSGYSRMSARSRQSAHDPLIERRDSARSDSSGWNRGERTTQKTYIASEDLTIVIAGFQTSAVGYGIYLALCLLTAGLAYLVFRWIPKWKVNLIGRKAFLGDCYWVVIENQWNEMSVHNVRVENYGESLSTVFGADEKAHFRIENEDDDPVIDELHLLNYRYISFVFHPLKDKFLMNSMFKDPQWTDVKAVRVGIDADEAQSREQVFGSNVIDIEQKSVPQLLVDEAFHPFYVFQIASLILWSVDEYYYYAGCILLISLASIITTLIETRQTMKRLREISRYECDVRVLRNGFWTSLPSGALVPGDIYEVSDPALSQFPCDSLLLAGDCIVNESMLTGESVPVSKAPASDETLAVLNFRASSILPSVAKNFLFAGTKIIRARRPQDGEDEEAVALGLVVRTGFNTTKGALVRSMLFPKPSGFKFYRDSFRYISVMAAVAGVGFIASLVNFIRLHLAAHLIIVRALDLITIVVPPALPATLSIGINFALGRLKQKNIFCISPQRVNVGGKLDIVCFDKTGTLTEDGLDILGLRIVHRGANRFSDLLNDVDTLLPSASYERDPTIDYDFQKAALYTMATCHSLRAVDGALIGDPLDYKMFEFTGWSFEEGGKRDKSLPEDEAGGVTPSIARPPPGLEYDIDGPRPGEPSGPIELGILRNFEFVSQLRRSSVLVRQQHSQGADVFVKGAPECMKEICKAESFPNDYEDLLQYYTHRGFRVIACATKHFEKLSWLKSQSMTRTDAESDLEFIGFIIFENKLKEATTDVIDELNEAKIRSVMCTGDNILTAISVARECHLIDKTAHCFVPHFVKGDSQDPKAQLSWQSIDNSVYQLNPETLLPEAPPVESDASLPYDISNIRNYSLAVSGDVFRWLIEFGRGDIVNRMLVAGQVFARMSPDEKQELVEKLQTLDYCVGFCGDGANDCGALKAADVGISLSEAEASVAAPFTSRIFDITCVPEVIREGRAALVTSFCCFKYMSLYSAIQFTSVSFLYASASNLGDFQFLFIDLALILPIAIFMGWTGPYPHLSIKKPTASLVSRKVLTPLLGQVVICILTQFIGWELVQREDWYLPPQLDTEESNIENSQNTTLFLISCFQYILSGVVLSTGYPFRQSMTENLPFVVTIVVALLFTSYLLFDPLEEIADFMQLTFLSVPFRIKVLVISVAGFAIAWIAERHVFLYIAKGLGKFYTYLRPSQVKKRKEYKLLLEKMRF